MFRSSLCIVILFLGLNSILGKAHSKYANIARKRSFPQHDSLRSSRHLIGKIIDTETNTVYNIDGHKEIEPQLNHVAASRAEEEALPFVPSTHPTSEQIACLAACHACIEEYPLNSPMKRAADNCGPMCDCADSCFRLPMEQVDKLYGRGSTTHGDKECWWKTFNEMLNHEIPTLS